MRIAAIAVMLLVASAMPSVAQAPTPASITIGNTRLILGASKESVLTELRKNYSVVQGSGADEYYVRLRGEKIAVEAFVSFENDGLSSATKMWNLHTADTGGNLMKSIYGALLGVSKSSEPCTISAFDDPDPVSDKKGIHIACGQRLIEMAVLSVTGSRGNDAPIVSETISDK